MRVLAVFLLPAKNPLIRQTEAVVMRAVLSSQRSGTLRKGGYWTPCRGEKEKENSNRNKKREEKDRKEKKGVKGVETGEM